MSRSVTFRLPDHLYAEVAKVCERRKIDLTSFMVQAAALRIMPSNDLSISEPIIAPSSPAAPTFGPQRAKAGSRLKVKK